jgi:primosomal protein N' (replication factor Y)
VRYYGVFIADARYRGDAPLIYSSEDKLKSLSVVTVPLRQRMVTGFIVNETDKPDFTAKPIRTLLSQSSLPSHCFELAKWLQKYYVCSYGEALRQFAPSKPTIRRSGQKEAEAEAGPLQLELDSPLTSDQKMALKFIKDSSSTTVLLHGDTGTGKTRVYIELAQETLATGKSVILLTPEIALTSQLAAAVEQQLPRPAFVLHSQLSDAKRKKIWLAILESKEPVVIIGPRSALFSPVHKLGLIVLDEAHESSYKQEQSPRYQASRVASQLGVLTGSKVILGSATPSVVDYYLAESRSAIARMKQPAIGSKFIDVKSQLIDLKDRSHFSQNPYLSKQLIKAMESVLKSNKQVMLYLNRRGTARLILCQSCGWQLLCPNCDVPLIYHGDSHSARCHICGYKQTPPQACPECASPDVIYKSIGTKALVESVAKLFPQYRLQRFDSDNLVGERVNEVYKQLRAGEIDILIGTQLLAKGFDLPKLGLVGVISAETALSLPDFTSEERSFQLLYQVIGRVGRGHGKGQVIVQSYSPESVVIKSALKRDWQPFYEHIIAQRRQYRFPPFSYLLKLVCRRTALASAESAANKLKAQLEAKKLPVEIVGPSPAFYARRGKYYYWQLVVKSKSRDHLVELAKLAPQDWSIDLDPDNLL